MAVAIATPFDLEMADYELCLDEWMSLLCCRARRSIRRGLLVRRGVHAEPGLQPHRGAHRGGGLCCATRLSHLAGPTKSCIGWGNSRRPSRPTTTARTTRGCRLWIASRSATRSPCGTAGGALVFTSTDMDEVWYGQVEGTEGSKTRESGNYFAIDGTYMWEVHDGIARESHSQDRPPERFRSYLNECPPHQRMS